MKFSLKITLILFFVVSLSEISNAQSLTFNPYSRYGIGELNQQGLSHTSAMGGTFIGLKPDTLAPIYVNLANPAAIAGIRFTTLELGLMAQFNTFSNGVTDIKTKAVNFAYGTIGFPIRKRSAGCFGIMPYSSVGYSLQTTEDLDNIGHVTYNYSADGGLNRAFAGYAVNPFKGVLNKFYRSADRDTIIKYNQVKKYKRKKFVKELLSEASIGVKGAYLFGTMTHTANVVYPGSITYYNTRRVRSTKVGDITGDFGFQTAFTVDSVGKRALQNKVKIGIGYFMALPKLLNATSNNVIYNYGLNGEGAEINKDTALYNKNKKGTIQLPLEQGIGFSFKKGEKLSIAADFAYTDWQKFRFLDNPNQLSNSYRVSLGINFCPDKTYGSVGAAAYFKRIQYRIGGSYSNGFLELKNTSINSYMITAGLGLPAGRSTKLPSGHVLINMLNISAQYGSLGAPTNGLIQQKYIRLIVGFTFNDEWFRKFRYD